MIINDVSSFYKICIKNKLVHGTVLIALHIGVRLFCFSFDFITIYVPHNSRNMYDIIVSRKYTLLLHPHSEFCRIIVVTLLLQVMVR